MITHDYRGARNINRRFCLGLPGDIETVKKEMNMSARLWKRMAIAATVMMVVSGAAHAEDECSNATLKGLYGFSLRG
jgi:hypothetical protein